MYSCEQQQAKQEEHLIFCLPGGIAMATTPGSTNVRSPRPQGGLLGYTHPANGNQISPGIPTRPSNTSADYFFWPPPDSLPW